MHFSGRNFDKFAVVIHAAAFVFVAYAGVTKIAAVGGEISIDIYPKGKNKAQILKDLKGPVIFFGDKCQHATYHAPLTRRKQINRRAMDWPSYSRDVLISRRGQSDAFNFIATTLLK